MEPDFYKAQFDPIYADERWILCVDAAAGATQLVERVLTAGAESVMIVAGTVGTGDPPPDDMEVFITGSSGETMMEGIRSFSVSLQNPSDALREAINRFDPDGRARVISVWPIGEGDLLGRRIFGAPRPEWTALEDKMIIDELWDRAGIARAQHWIGHAGDSDAIRRAIRTIGLGDGAVIVADNSEGWHGGAEYTRYLAPSADWRASLEFFAQHADRVRITPFLRGVPCSIHGLVSPDEVLVFRPVEMFVYRKAGSDEFVYCGMGTLWDPSDDHRHQMREAVRAVGELIQREIGYRGAFGIDGVCTADGFFPTELNPRLTASLGLQTQAAGGYPIGGINRALAAGLDFDLRANELEATIIDSADAVRKARWIRPIVHLTKSETDRRYLGYNDSGWVPVDETSASATMAIGPSAQGAIVMASLTDQHGFAHGEPFAETAAASFALADEWWDTRIGDLIPGTAEMA